MSKTAIQEMMLEIEANYPQLFDVYSQLGRSFMNDMSKFLEIEKEQIIKAFNEGTWSDDEKIKADEYYKLKYGRHN